MKSAGAYENSQMMNIYDFICAHSHEFRQLKFENGNKIFIDYHCPINQNKARVWSHKNCLMYVLGGSKTYEASNSSHTSRENHLLFARKGGLVLHQKFEKPYHALIFMFDDEAVKNLFLEYPQLSISRKSQSEIKKHPTVVALESSMTIRSVFVSCLEYIKKNTVESQVALEIKFRELMVNLLENKSANAFNNYLFEVSTNKNLSFIQLMNENSYYNFNSKELARIAGMSLSSFKRKFREVFETSPGKWLRQKRMEKAKTLLTDPTKNISETAFDLGYNDTAAFSKAFGLYTGITPTEYQKNLP